MTNLKPKDRITEVLLDQIVGGRVPTEFFQSRELRAELRRKLEERTLDAEMNEHLS